MSPNHRQRRLLLRALALVAASSVVAPAGQVLATGTGLAPGALIFDDRRRAMVTVLAEMILPCTETPGAIEAGVPAFIETMVGTWYTSIERRIFFQGLDALDACTRKRGGRDFNHSDETVRTQALVEAERATLAYFEKHQPSYDPKTADENTPFFTKLQDLTVVGFFTSAAGAQRMHGHPQTQRRSEGVDGAVCATRGSLT